MKKVLMAAYSFPPTGGPGVQRSLKFVKYFRDFGWEPVVLTREVANMQVRDESLGKDIPEGVKVFRTKAWESSELPGLMGKVMKVAALKLLIPDKERLWAVSAKKTAVRIIKEEGIDLIYTTSVPYSAHMMGLYLKKRFPGIPWVADFRDEWTNNPYLLDNPHPSFRMKIERKMEQEVLKNADCLVTNTPVMLDNFLRLNPSLNLRDRFFDISNGFDRDDFGAVEPDATRHEKMVLTYTGSLYGRRKPDTFFQALYELLEERSVDRGKITVKLIGSFKEKKIIELIEMHKLNDVVKVLPYIPHNECVEKMMHSDALLLIEGSGPGGEAFYTGKVFEYMMAARPIIAIIPEKGAAARLIRETRTGLVSDFSDIQKTKANILEYYKAWIEGRDLYHPDLEEVGKYDRKVLTGRMSGVFEKACVLAGKVKSE